MVPKPTSAWHIRPGGGVIMKTSVMVGTILVGTCATLLVLYCAATGRPGLALVNAGLAVVNLFLLACLLKLP
jgi:hypothetical protein